MNRNRRSVTRLELEQGARCHLSPKRGGGPRAFCCVVVQMLRVPCSAEKEISDIQTKMLQASVSARQLNHTILPLVISEEKDDVEKLGLG
jgi:hypothetical protein